ncbi:MAG: hypothetical protein U0K48_05820 [Bacilli bacterium]|nr:hypothetical protein [Bacilli bacterium]
MDRKDIFMSGFKSKIGYSFTYKDLNEFEAIINFYEQQCKKQKEVIDKINIFLNNHDKNAGKLYYKYNNKYLLSEIKEDIRNILKEVE